MTFVRTLSRLLASALLAIAAPAYAADGHSHGKEHAHGEAESHFEVKAPERVKDAWAMITGKVAEAESALGAKNLEVAHSAGEHMEAAVHALKDKSDMVAVEARAKLASALKQLDKSVDELHHAAEDTDADAALAALTKIKGLLPLIEGLYPAGTLN